MIRYGKTTQSAVATMSRLAEAYAEDRPLSSDEIARDRRLSRALVAKLLTILSQAKLVAGTRGPGGGYRLAKPPRTISLYDITTVFERSNDAYYCPFGPNWCERQEPCPLHDAYVGFAERFNKYLRETRLDVFVSQKKARRRGSPRKP
jgi:Rrf2 family protein